MTVDVVGTTEALHPVDLYRWRRSNNFFAKVIFPIEKLELWLRFHYKLWR